MRLFAVDWLCVVDAWLFVAVDAASSVLAALVFVVGERLVLRLGQLHQRSFVRTPGQPLWRLKAGQEFCSFRLRLLIHQRRGIAPLMSLVGV